MDFTWIFFHFILAFMFILSCCKALWAACVVWQGLFHLFHTAVNHCDSWKTGSRGLCGEAGRLFTIIRRQWDNSSQKSLSRCFCYLWFSEPPTAFQQFPGPRPRCGRPGGRCCGSWSAPDPPGTDPPGRAAPADRWSLSVLPTRCHRAPAPAWQTNTRVYTLTHRLMRQDKIR